MADPMKQAWEEVGDGFLTLARLMKERYNPSGASGEGAAGTDDVAAPAAAATGPSEAQTEAERRALRDALEKLVAAGRELGERAADVVHDPAVKSQARQAVTSLNNALSATVDQIGAEVGGLFKGGARGGAAGDASGPTTDAASNDPTAPDAPAPDGASDGP